MKRLIFLLISGITALPILAQLNGDGYYRLQNTGSYGRYLTISNNKIDEINKNHITSGKEGSVYALKTITDPVSDPSSIIYISKDNTVNSNNAYNIQAQGVNPLKFLKDKGAELKIYPDKGNYLIYGSKDGMTLFLVDNPGADGYIIAAGKGAYPQNQTWKLYPVDQVVDYFGITPDERIKIGDKYYTTIYASFPFQLGKGMKAYSVVDSKLKSGIPYAELKEINGKVPAGTPVIIECSSLDPADNKVNLLTGDDAPTAISGNKLKGVYFCYIKMSAKDPQKENDKEEFKKIKNATNYDSKKMRVLGLVNGKLGLVDADDDALVVTDQGRYLPANKAYFPIDESVAEATANGIRLLDKQGIEDLSKLITDNKAIFEKNEEEENTVSLTDYYNVSGNYEIPEKVTGNDGKVYTVTRVASYAFKGNKRLTSITIPSSINSIEDAAFSGCENLKEISIEKDDPIDLGPNGASVFEGVNFETCVLYVPESSIEKYKADKIWGKFKNILSHTSGINDIRLDENKASDVYNLQGQIVLRQTSNIEQLPKGVYIINGKKIIKK